MPLRHREKGRAGRRPVGRAHGGCGGVCLWHDVLVRRVSVQEVPRPSPPANHAHETVRGTSGGGRIEASILSPLKSPPLAGTRPLSPPVRRRCHLQWLISARPAASRLWSRRQRPWRRAGDGPEVQLREALGGDGGPQCRVGRRGRGVRQSHIVPQSPPASPSPPGSPMPPTHRPMTSGINP
ncbi:hypothetical protein SETIT_9G495700v2 [Setaria italica]|uniref:Uncharacterized protein n=2 Tax=Setaria TaxID=4554 RepID=A0A368SU69_SETIT|nr:hypothetical protein SETIT_9G495700v2 [Setaria italica]TKV97523.1 hypothetical protein SEVIR_9G499900v2 [Setaria viridis]